MRCVMSAAVFLFVCQVAFAQHFHRTATPAPEDELRGSPCAKTLAAAVLQPDLQKVSWAVTGNETARKLFSQGMTQYYGFNYEEALRNFLGAAAADPSMAMASWGIALAAGPNINLGMDKDCHRLAQEQSGKAVEQAKTQPGITALERAVINALPLRYAYPVTDKPDPDVVKKALKAYSEALGAKWEELKYDANFGALYAESLIELHPWDLYDKDHHKTSPDTDTVLKVLKTAMDVDSQAVGANHYYIHAVEAGPTPKDGLNSADLLQTRVEASGHLVHMPSHIYLLLGDYKKAVDSNVQASSVDVGQYGDACHGTFEEYTANDKCPQLYYGHYLSHNYFFGSVAATFSGQSTTAVTMACDTRTHVECFVANEPDLQRYMTAPLMTLVVNRNWDAILAYPEPPATCYIQPPFQTQTGCHILRSIWHWARGMAYATRGNLTPARDQYLAMESQMKEIKPPTPVGWGNNLAADVLAVAQQILQARIIWPNNQPLAIATLKVAVTNENKLKYDEPPQWFAPARESLGGAYLQKKEFGLAELTFDDELKRHPASGRALYGRLRALIGRHATSKDIDEAKQRYCRAWMFADYTMTDGDLWPSIDGTSPDPGFICERQPKPIPPSQSTCKTPSVSPPVCPRPPAGA
jgi:tetratricopeptide (TPR) repeat protein